MFGLVVTFFLKEGGEAAFDGLVESTVAQIADKEPNTLAYIVHKVEGKPGVRVFYELYRDRRAFEEHERQSHTRHFLTSREEFFSRPPEVDFLHPTTAAGLVARPDA